ncbi:MAG TPA: hypothetical protein PLI57_11460 [Spirochaetota bacterium]|nr:hypothetical protein [Spirochaetota bacterium]
MNNKTFFDVNVNHYLRFCSAVGFLVREIDTYGMQHSSIKIDAYVSIFFNQ